MAGTDSVKLVTFEIGAEFGWDEGHCQPDIGSNRRDVRLPLAKPERIVCEFRFHGLHESRTALSNAQAQSVASKRLVGRVVVDRFKVLSCAIVARVWRDDRSGVENRQAIGINKKLELDFITGWRDTVWPGRRMAVASSSCTTSARETEGLAGELAERGKNACYRTVIEPSHNPSVFIVVHSFQAMM
jgi:hypothetical protein